MGRLDRGDQFVWVCRAGNSVLLSEKWRDHRLGVADKPGRVVDRLPVDQLQADFLTLLGRLVDRFHQLDHHELIVGRLILSCLARDGDEVRQLRTVRLKEYALPRGSTAW